MTNFKIQEILTSKLKENPDNPRSINDFSFSALLNSIKENKKLFEARPILCSKRKNGSLVVIAGNMRLRAAKKLNMKTVPVIIFEGLSLLQEKEIMIKDNGEFGEWDFSVIKEKFINLPLADYGLIVPENLLDDEIPKENIVIDESSPKIECPKCGYKW